jgi:hypothetical protein
MEFKKVIKVVKNVSGLEINEESRKNWLSYWNYFSSQNNNACADENCNSASHHAVLVKDAQLASDKLFVVPVCKECGYKHEQNLNLCGSIDLVPAELSL